jgi:hypothetical protein
MLSKQPIQNNLSITRKWPLLRDTSPTSSTQRTEEEGAKQDQAPKTSLSANSHFPSWSPLSTSFPSSVSSGRPSGVTAPTKNLGCHSAPLSSLSFAFVLCLSSNSCFKVVARENCLAAMASVTPDQKRRLSLGSCCSVGGRILGATDRGVRSMIWISWSYLPSVYMKKRGDWESKSRLLEQGGN